VLSRDGWWAGDVVWYGADGGPDLSRESRSIAWCVGDLYVMANAWWHPMVFTLQADGPWRRVVDTEAMPPRDIVPEGVPVSGGVYTVGPRAVVVLERA
jgi:hypothetical protein